MSLSRPSATEGTQPSVPARVASNWIEFFAVPIASALMEAQPIYLVLQLFFTRLTLSINYLDVGSITLLLLLFHWWAIWGYYRRERRGEQLDFQVGMHVTWFDVLGIALGLLILALSRYYALGDTLTVIMIIILTGWAWKRGVDRARAGFSEDQLILFFKLGLGAIMVVLLFSLLGDIGSTYSLNDELLRDLPIFFLSGFVALSFTRIGAARREQAKHPQAAIQEGTNRWVVALTITWFVLIALCVVLEILPNDVLIMLLSPLWSLIGWLAQLLLLVINWIIYGFFFLLNWLLSGFPHLLGGALTPQQAAKQTSSAHNILTNKHQPPASPTTMLILRLLVIAIAVAILITIVLVVRNKQKNTPENTLLEEEEVREGLDMQQIRKERRQERRRQLSGTKLAPLEPDSVRVRYRSFLQSMAEKGGDFAHRNNETPGEYQKRLLLLAEHKLPANTAETPSDPAILNEFTHAYARERYGGQKPLDEQQSYLRQWVPHLLQRLATHLNPPPQPTQKRPYQPSRWGED
ncbi:DUF4129 domain-containing protein [Dictyobacter kobayashii]|uniref:Protein-glutamine gamma-glutamyltransferase-like C-terminal domain-containing protein n=1 Tax=Dictyobacter kobayashii TaxID=2014872 RepID=A0A402AJK4_9CHLR|nr:DUF4129 domain-containing protein [Dictyobacter kobayashii]GCE19244.1 hypothetical protein KDK_30440 [Dictyobacter kobayashii]